MKRNLIRFFAIVLSVACVFILACPALAEPLDYRDYEKYVTVDGDKDLVTLEFPFEDWADWIFASSELYYQERGKGISPFFFENWMSYYTDYHFLIAPFGDSTLGWGEIPVPQRYLSLNNIPADATWSAHLKTWIRDEYLRLTLTSCFARSWMVDGDKAVIYQEIAPVSIEEVDACEFDIYYSSNMSSGYDGWFPQFLFSFETGSSNVSFDLISFEITMSISSLYRLQQQTGETNALLDEVNKQLAEQGKTMNDILNGTPEQNESANNAAGILGDKGEQLGGLANAIQPDKPNLDSVNTNVGDLVPSAGVNALTSAISPIANNDLVIKVLVMVATLILVSYVLFGKRG